jgi:23S rRNA (guanosine2251-2'-O)-methyltransferase
VPRDPALRDELLSLAERELAAADALFAAVEADKRLNAALERRMAGPSTSLVAALVGWDEAPPEASALLEVNAANAARLDAIIDAGSWPGLREVGADGADAAWMLAQHADGANEQRRRWLQALRDAVDAGDADPRHFATLADRVAAVAGEPQIYGTIALLADDGEVEFPLRVADAAALDARRGDIGLPPMAVEARYLTDGEIVPYEADRGSNPVNQWPLVLEGHVSVEAALEAGIRRVHRVWAVRPGDRRLGRLRALARQRAVLIEQVEPAAIDEVASGRSHGGVIALVGPRDETPLPRVLAEVDGSPLIVMLDGVEDPYNYGQAVRALYAAGAAAVVVRRSWETALTTVTRASAGATELLPAAVVSSADEAGTLSRRAGLRVACAVSDPSATELHDADMTGGLFVLIGGERRGVTRSFVDEADLLVRIGYGRERAPELGTAASAAIIAFEALRQRRGGLAG